MKIEHVAIWVRELESMRNFYEKYFNGVSNEKYCNESKGFESYFVHFDRGARLELMRKLGINKETKDNQLGWAHIAFSLGSKEKVDQLTSILRRDGFVLVDGPRVTGDGYYETVVRDPEGNLIELTV